MRNFSLKCMSLLLVIAFALGVQAVDIPKAEPSKEEESKKEQPKDENQLEDYDSSKPQSLGLKRQRPSENVSGVVIGIRRKNGTEVLIKGVSSPVVIPFLSYHNKMLNRCLDSQKKSSNVTLRIDSESRQVLDDPQDPVQ